MHRRAFLVWNMRIVLASLLLMSLRSVSGAVSTNLEITIASTPSDLPSPSMADEPIKGKVTGGDPNVLKDLKVVIYALGGDTWYVQPTIAEPNTDIEENGDWESKTHGGDKFVALLVKSSYKPKATLDKIPDVRGEIVAKSKPAPPGRKPAKKTDKLSE